MPTFQNPTADAAEASEALRGLAHATRVLDDPADTYAVLGDLLAGVRSLRQVLDQLAQSVRQYPNTLIRIEGHADATGNAQFNQTLSENRAHAVASYLMQHGVDPKRIEAVGFGSTRPIASNATAEGRAQNRRVEILLIPLAQ